jgi:hypothetical protein
MLLRRVGVVVAFALLFSLAGCGTPSKAKQAADAAKKKEKKKRTSNDVKPGPVTDKDKEYATKLMADGGRWSMSETDEDGTTKYMYIYLPKGILNEVIDDDERNSGTWEVQDGYLIYTLGDVKTADKIKEITDKEFIYVDHETQKTVIETKVKE